MGCLGVHFALTKEEEAKLLALPTDAERIFYLINDIEEAWDEANLVQSEKAWQAIHRVMTEYPREADADPPVMIASGYGPEGARLAVLGGIQLYAGDDHFISYVPADKVPLVAAAMQEIDEATFRARYIHHVPEEWDEYGEDRLEYTWEYFCAVRNFYVNAVASGRSVVFTADW